MIGRGNSFIAEWWWLRVDDWKGDSFIAEWWWLRVDDWKGDSFIAEWWWLRVDDWKGEFFQMLQSRGGAYMFWLIFCKLCMYTKHSFCNFLLTMGVGLIWIW